MSELPQFDYSKLSHRDSKALGRVQLRLQRLIAQLADSTGIDDDEFEAKLIHLDELISDAEEVIAKVLVSVPQSWLVPGAPTDIDWVDVESLGWVRTDKMDALRDAAVEARSPQAVSGN
jgi:hypothetical protein